MTLDKYIEFLKAYSEHGLGSALVCLMNSHDVLIESGPPLVVLRNKDGGIAAPDDKLSEVVLWL